jgi:hypothetical protein
MSEIAILNYFSGCPVIFAPEIFAKLDSIRELKVDNMIVPYSSYSTPSSFNCNGIFRVRVLRRLKNKYYSFSGLRTRSLSFLSCNLKYRSGIIPSFSIVRV